MKKSFAKKAIILLLTLIILYPTSLLTAFADEGSLRDDVVIKSGQAPRVGAPSPYLPLWEHIPDGEPRLFQDPDDPTRDEKTRVYLRIA